MKPSSWKQKRVSDKRSSRRLGKGTPVSAFQCLFRPAQQEEETVFDVTSTLTT